MHSFPVKGCWKVTEFEDDCKRLRTILEALDPPPPFCANTAMSEHGHPVGSLFFCP